MFQSILVVDDEPLVVDALARLLSREFDVDTATSGMEAIEKLSQNSYAAVVSDLQMRDVNGLTLLKHAYVHSPESARILITANIDLDEHAASIKDCCISSILHKPCHYAVLRTAIRDACKAVSSGQLN